MTDEEAETKRRVDGVVALGAEVARKCGECGPDLGDVLDVDPEVERVAGIGVLRSHKILDEAKKRREAGP